MKLTKEILKEHSACEQGYKWFLEKGKETVEETCEALNAYKWAMAFMQTVMKRKLKVDSGLMVSWFANAIMTTHDRIYNTTISELNKRIEKLLEENHQLGEENNDLSEKLDIAKKSLAEIYVFGKNRDKKLYDDIITHMMDISHEALKKIDKEVKGK